MLITTRRTRKLIFISMTLLAGVLAYHDEGLHEIFEAFEHREEFNVALHMEIAATQNAKTLYQEIILY